MKKETQEKIVFPSLEDWKNLYDRALEFKEIAPWNWMWDTDIFGVQNLVNGEIGYCCVLGRLKEFFGLAVYLGFEGLQGYLKESSEDFDLNDLDTLHIKKCLLLSFENRNYLSKDDLSVINQLGLKFLGKNSWPQFRSYRPGYFPWKLTKEEAVYMTICLEQAKDVCLRFREDPDMFKYPQANCYFTRILKREGDNFKWMDTWLEPTPIHKMVMMVKTIDEGRLKNIEQLTKRQKVIWEVDYFYSPAYIAEKSKRPYFPLIFLWVDQYSYFILSTHMTTQDKYKAEFIDYCLDVFESTKILPEEIQVRKEELFIYLQPISQRLEIKVKLVKRLSAVDEARKSMIESFSKRIPK